MKPRLDGRRAALAAALLALALVPAVADEFYVVLFTKILVLGIFAMSLDLLVGYTGLPSLGHAAYFGAAAYAAMVLAPESAPANLLLTLPASVLVAALLALATGALAVRTAGMYFIMVTLAFGQMAYFAVHDSPYLGGSDGKLLFARPVVAFGGAAILDFAEPQVYYLLVLACLAGSYGILRAVVQSPFGRVIQGIRVNEARMQALGYATYRYKLASFAIGGAFAGLAGYLAAYQAEYVNPKLLGWQESGLALVMVILGGVGTLHGAVLGSAAIVLLQEFFSELTSHWMLLLGLFIVGSVIWLPHGIVGIRAWARRARTR
ncbi:MAG: branched-chain amino acid ABC transporter permease [Rhodospirillales bacterium]|nr:branched-chain amino acid ABC transporter permease [Rhodospirillales bacterium]